MKTANIFFAFFIYFAISIFSPAHSQALCSEKPSIHSDSCSVRRVNINGKKVAHYEFSRWTLTHMARYAEESKSSIYSEVQSILKHMNNKGLKSVGIIYEPVIKNNRSVLPDCNIYGRKARGQLDNKNIVYRYGSENCYEDGTSLVILFGETIDRLNNIQTRFPYSHIGLNEANFVSKPVNFQEFPSELISILNFHDIDEPKLKTISKKLNFDIIKISVPTVTYTVETGDSMYKISKKTTGKGQAWRDIWAINPQIKEPSRLKVGDKVMVPPHFSGYGEIELEASKEEIAKKYYGDKIYSNWVQDYIDSAVKLAGKRIDLRFPKIAQGQDINPYQVAIPVLRIEE